MRRSMDMLWRQTPDEIFRKPRPLPLTPKRETKEKKVKKIHHDGRDSYPSRRPVGNRPTFIPRDKDQRRCEEGYREKKEAGKTGKETKAQSLGM